LLSEMHEISKEGFDVKLIFITREDKDQKIGFFEKLQARAFPYMPFGKELNHVALQIGPYLIQWTLSSLVTISPLATYSACPSIYPNEDFRIKEPEQIQKICDVIAQYNMSNTYHALDCNCQHFVWFMMDILKCKPKWKPNGHIRTFIEEISKSNIGVHQMKIRDFHSSNSIEFKDYKDFLAFCENSQVMQIIQALKPKKKNTPSNEQKEYASLLRCIERAFQLNELAQNEVIGHSHVMKKLQVRFPKAVFQVGPSKSKYTLYNF